MSVNMVTPAINFPLGYEKLFSLLKARRGEDTMMQANSETGVYRSQWANGFDQSKFVLGTAVKHGVNSIIALQHDTQKTDFSIHARLL